MFNIMVTTRRLLLAGIAVISLAASGQVSYPPQSTTGPSGTIVGNYTAGAAGVTANTLVYLDGAAAATVSPVTTTTTQLVLGIVQATAAPGVPVVVTLYGPSSCVSSNATTAGHLLIPAGSAGQCSDSGSSSSSAIAPKYVVGVATSAVSAGATAAVQFTGSGQYQGNPVSISGYIYGSTTTTDAASIAVPITKRFWYSTALTINTAFTIAAGLDGQEITLCFLQGTTAFTVTPPSNYHGFFAVNAGAIGTTVSKLNCQHATYHNTAGYWVSDGGGVINE